MLLLNGLLTSNQYINLTQCETLEDLKLQLSSTDYGNFLSDVSGQISTSTIQNKASGKLFDEFQYIRDQAVNPLKKFLDYITYGYMIDNVSLMITGTIHGRNKDEILERCHPLGWFETLPALVAAVDVQALQDILRESPLQQYFKESDLESAEILDDLNIEIIRNRLYKAYLEDFYKFAKHGLSDPDNVILTDLLEFEADRRTINITTNSIESDLTAREKVLLLPRFGKLYPDFSDQLAKADTAEAIRNIIEDVGDYKLFFDNSNGKSIEDHFYEREMNLCRDAFTQQFTFSTIWAWLRSKEQEVRNITWIAECIAQNQKDPNLNLASSAYFLALAGLTNTFGTFSSETIVKISSETLKSADPINITASNGSNGKFEANLPKDVSSPSSSKTAK
ncbi:hypothetical protein WICMUC_004479 [Wickerhamomyces mucosus]|uniref:V-type proton ATPase subunit n=1 Tax=Wickerhamomyces mucosus TaxID=1378264 RepID=A0A9P8PH89_9ASCO|nr:hypothetical protein WICMUC_004479 [Wickerhamomyces mucosus]